MNINTINNILLDLKSLISLMEGDKKIQWEKKLIELEKWCNNY